MKDLSKIFLASSQFLDVPVRSFSHTDRHRQYAEARFMLMMVLRTSFRMSYTEIGKNMNRNHATIIHGVKKMKDLREAYPELNDKYLKLRDYIYENGFVRRRTLTENCNKCFYEIKIGINI